MELEFQISPAFLVASPYGSWDGRDEVEEPAGDPRIAGERRGPPTAAPRSGIDPLRQQRTS